MPGRRASSPGAGVVSPVGIFEMHKEVGEKKRQQPPPQAKDDETREAQEKDSRPEAGKNGMQGRWVSGQRFPSRCRVTEQGDRSQVRCDNDHARRNNARRHEDKKNNAEFVSEITSHRKASEHSPMGRSYNGVIKAGKRGGREREGGEKMSVHRELCGELQEPEHKKREGKH